MSRSKAELRLIRSATAYKRLAWKRDTSSQQAERYLARAERLLRQADAIAARRAQSDGRRAS